MIFHFVNMKTLKKVSFWLCKHTNTSKACVFLSKDKKLRKRNFPFFKHPELRFPFFKHAKRFQNMFFILSKWKTPQKCKVCFLPTQAKRFVNMFFFIARNIKRFQNVFVILHRWSMLQKRVFSFCKYANRFEKCFFICNNDKRF